MKEKKVPVSAKCKGSDTKTCIEVRKQIIMQSMDGNKRTLLYKRRGYKEIWKLRKEKRA
jgi:hypothetical protein